jgi:hypothetical protein
LEQAPLIATVTSGAFVDHPSMPGTGEKLQKTACSKVLRPWRLCISLMGMATAIIKIKSAAA